MSNVMWKQCEIEKGTVRLVAWLPIEFCKRGRPLRLCGEDGFRVRAVYGPPINGDVLTFLKDWKQFASTFE